jgi:hypothetical protein
MPLQAIDESPHQAVRFSFPESAAAIVQLTSLKFIR